MLPDKTTSRPGFVREPLPLPLVPNQPAPANHTRVSAAGLLAADLLALAGTAFMTMWLTGYPGTGWRWLAGLAPLPVLYALLGLYPGFGLPLPERLRRRWTAGLACLAPTALGLAALDTGAEKLAAAGLVYLLVAPLTEGLARRILHACGLWGKPALILSTQKKDARQHWLLGLLPVTAQTPLNGEPDTLILGPGERLPNRLAPGTTLYLETDGGLIGGNSRPRHACPLTTPGRQLKRLLDLAVTGVILPPALMLTALAALVIYATDPGPVLFSQIRRGQAGKPVRIWKLRSMYRDSQARLDNLLARDQKAADEWYAHYKLAHDPRVLPLIGPFIRSYSIDELPQLWNVLTGDLSLVGPRVFLDYDLERYEESSLRRREAVLPGLTGLWQVTVRNHGGSAEKIRYDNAYVTGWTWWGDLDILYRTVGAVLTGRGAS